jgi:hypothetical protein
MNLEWPAVTKLAHEPHTRHCHVFVRSLARTISGVSQACQLRPQRETFGSPDGAQPPDPCAFANSFGDPRSRTLHSHLSFLLFPCCDSEFPIEGFSTYSSTTMSDTKIRAPPSHYPFLAFHLVRTCSLVCSIIVSGILLYFCYWLKHDNYKIPWTFLVVCQIPSQPVYA